MANGITRTLGKTGAKVSRLGLGGHTLLMPAACLKYALGFNAADAVLVAVRRLSQLEENIRVWRSGEGPTPAEREALEAGRGYAIPNPDRLPHVQGS